MAIDWPITLPELPLHDGYSAQQQSGVIKDDRYSGKINRRRRFTATSKFHNVDVVLTKTEYLIFLNFFNISIAGGAIPFVYKNPIFQNGSITCRIQNSDNPYTVTYDGTTLDYRVSFVLEELPGTVVIPYYTIYKATSAGERKATSAGELKIVQE